MANELGLLAKERQNLLQAELAAFLHNIGKCSEEFIEQWSKESKEKPKPHEEQFFEQYASGCLLKLVDNISAQSQSLKDRSKNAATTKTQGLLSNSDKENIFWNLAIFLPPPFDDRPGIDPNQRNSQEPYRLGFLADFHKGFVKLPSPPKRPGYNDDAITELLGNCYRALAACHVAHHLVSGEEKELAEPVKREFLKPQSFDATWIATSYGYELKKLSSSAHELAEGRNKLLALLRELQPGTGLDFERYQDFMKCASPILVNALGETERPINDVRLWDLSHSTASFFKSGVAGLVCSGETKDTLAASDIYKKLHWRYLTLSLDFFQFAASAQKIIDVVARRDKLDECYAVLKKLLETNYPLANEIYRDEYGPVYLIPEADVLSWDDGTETLREKILHCFRVPAHPKYAQEGISEKIIDALPVFHDQIEAGVENVPTLQKALAKREPLNTAQPEEVQALWDKLRSQNHFAEVCPVCGLRPVGCDDEACLNEIAKDRKICAVCLSRRSGRARQWREENSRRTIWIEEAADENGRAALICGRFNLDGWLNGDHIRGIKKNPSFARIQRCWETTKTFWEEIQDKHFPQVFGDPRPRLVISASNLPDPKKLGPFQACELKLGNIFMNVVFDRDNQVFISADNLLAVAQALFGKRQKTNSKKQTANGNQRAGKEKLSNPHEEAAERIIEYLLANRDRPLKNPGHYGETAEELGKIHVDEAKIEKDDEGYFPLIPILREPATFMCIVPANKALTLAEVIKTKYAKEMAKVRDRLPLHLGIVFFQKYVPAGAVLDAGRRLLENAALLKEGAWQIQGATFYNGNGHAVAIPQEACEIELHLHQPQTKRYTKTRIALCLDPKETDEKKRWDKIHPQLRRADATNLETLWAGMAKNETIYFAPSTFDYLFLDAASRRFESILDKDAQRRFHPLWGLRHSPRPYDLEALTRFRELWLQLRANSLLSASKLYGIRDLLARKIQDWHVFAEPDDTTAHAAYENLVEEILRKEFGYQLNHAYFAATKTAMMDGSFFDCLDLYLHILKEPVKPQNSRGNDHE